MNNMLWNCALQEMEGRVLSYGFDDFPSFDGDIGEVERGEAVFSYMFISNS